VSVEIVNAGSLEPVDGTSCASPIFASVIGLLNNELAAAGKPALGFLNPWLYSTAASALNDITSGSNTGCNTNGFSAKAGWDPVRASLFACTSRVTEYLLQITGLGSPNYAKLRAAAGL
jgi:tripeptidyl-peptidase-1